jgi:hypothetical protein
MTGVYKINGYIFLLVLMTQVEFPHTFKKQKFLSKISSPERGVGVVLSSVEPNLWTSSLNV